MSFTPKAILSEFVSVIDLFNDAVYLNINGRKNLATVLGATLSLTLAAVLLYQGISQSIDMFSLENPVIYQINEYASDPPALELNSQNNFFFAVSTSLNSVVTDMRTDSLYTFNIGFNQYFRKSDGTRTERKSAVYMAPCNETDFPEEIYGPNAYYANKLNLAFCPTAINFTDPITGKCPSDISSNYPSCITPPSFNIKGAYMSPEFEFIQFNLSICKATGPLPFGVGCSSVDIPATILASTSEINLFYANSNINPVFYDTPNKTIIDSTYWNVNPQLYRIVDIIMDIVVVQDFDSYWATDTYNNRSFYSIQTNKLREMETVVFQSGLPYLQWNLRRSSLTAVTTRTYSKIQDVMTNLGGFSTNLIFVAAFVALGYVRYKYQIVLSNELYEFQEMKKDNSRDSDSNLSRKTDKSEINITSRTTKDLFKDSAKKDLDDTEQVADVSNKSLKNYFDQHLKEGKKIPHGEHRFIIAILSEYLCCCCRKGPNRQLENNARKLVTEDLDIIKIINKVKEVDKLKLLLLNRYEREAFSFIEKHLIKMEGTETVLQDTTKLADTREREMSKMKRLSMAWQRTSVFKVRDDALAKYSKLYMAYRTIKKDTDPAHQKYNKKLIELIDPELLKIFRMIDKKATVATPGKFEDIVKKALANSIDNTHLSDN